MKKNNFILRLTRTERNAGFTTGVLQVGNRLLAHTLEPQWRDLHHEPPVRGDTAIPEGAYQVRLLFSSRFNGLMPQVMVPGFGDILICNGCAASESGGNILVGKRFKVNLLCDSRDVFSRVYDRLLAASTSGRGIQLIISNTLNSYSYGNS